MMCEYCKTEGNDMDNESLVDNTFKVGVIDFGIIVYIDPIDKTMNCMTTVGSKELFGTKPVKIQFCPICGRKL